MKLLIAKYKLHLSDKSFLISIFVAFIFLLVSLVISFYAGTYATEKASNAVTDIVLDNIPVFDVDGIFIYGPFVFWIFMVLLGLKEPKKIPFAVKSIALFIVIRSIFISLTHIGPFPDQIAIHNAPNFFQKFSFAGDLFFSAHTGLPFLMALTFWKENRTLGIIFTGVALFFGAIVLMAHLHYSIDVLSAFFITYTIFCMAEVLFKKDKKNFSS